MSMADTAAYRNIFKTTFLFGFVQVFNIIVKVGINKVVALLLGAEGLGIISLFQTSINMVKTGAGLGINQSGVRDISEAYGSGNSEAYSETISFVKKIIWFTSGLGLVAMIILSPILSYYSFGSGDYSFAYALLSIAVAATILNDGLKAILTGTRQLRSLARASMLGALVGLFTALPFYFLWGIQGIVPSLIFSAITMMAISYFYMNKVSYVPIHMSIKKAFFRSSSIIKMGISLMLMSFMLEFVNLIVASYISNHGGLSILGYYQSGITIIGGYFGIIITAMSTEYYPRISALSKDNHKLNDAVNSQSEVGLLLALPLVVLFVFLSPFFLTFLYSSDFVVASQYIDYAILGTIVIICSNSMGMILLAKQRSKLLLTSSFLMNPIIVAFYILLYRYYDLAGLGIAYFLSGFMQLVVFNLMMKWKFSISFNKSVFLKIFVVLSFIFLSKYARDIEITWIKYLAGTILLISSSYYSLYYMQKQMHINIFTSLRNGIKRYL